MTSEPDSQSDRSHASAHMTTLIWLVGAIAAMLGIALLWYARGLLAPLATAALLFVLLTAFFERIRSFRPFGWALPRWTVHVIGIGLFCLIMLLLANIVGGQIEVASSELTSYRDRLKGLTVEFGAFLGPQVSHWLETSVTNMDVGGAVSSLFNSAGTLVGTLGLIALYLGFMLAEERSLAAKLPRLVPDPGQRATVADAVKSINIGVQRYMLIMTAISLLTAVVCYGIMLMVGLNFAETWAVLIFTLNFIPTVGSIIGVLLPTLLALVQFTDLAPVLMILVGMGITQFVIGNILQPMISGRSLNIGPFPIILALTFWSAIWGLLGALLSVPMTVVIMIICKHVPPLRPFATLLESAPEPAADPDQPSTA